ncbi:MAG: putative TetR-type transcriptional regulator [Pseudonocardia sp.]|nr:putative TetR-type transcriptional regulator [Pseudonocardia sp.]
MILTAATIFQEKGYRATTLNDIAEALTTDRATLYRYITGKEELLREVIAESVVQIAEEVDRITLGDSPAPVKLRQVMTHVMTSYEAHYPHPYIFIQELLDSTWHENSDWAHHLVSMVREIQANVLGIFEQGCRDGELRTDIPIDIMANALLGMVNWTHRWYRPRDPYPGDEVGDSFATLLLDGLEASVATPATERPEGM